MHWFAEAERIHCRWAMLGAAGVLAQEIARPDIFWYETAVKIDLPFNIAGLVAFQVSARAGGAGAGAPRVVVAVQGVWPSPNTASTRPLTPFNLLPLADHRDALDRAAPRHGRAEAGLHGPGPHLQPVQAGAP